MCRNGCHPRPRADPRRPRKVREERLASPEQPLGEQVHIMYQSLPLVVDTTRREMNLDDGRFLISPTRYEELLKTQSKSELDALKLVPCHKDFQVIALGSPLSYVTERTLCNVGLPVPRFQGYTLDPPLRSRFQVRSCKEVGELRWFRYCN